MGLSQGQTRFVPGTFPGSSQEQPDQTFYVYVPFSCLTSRAEKPWQSPTSHICKNIPSEEGPCGIGIRKSTGTETEDVGVQTQNTAQTPTFMPYEPFLFGVGWIEKLVKNARGGEGLAINLACVAQ